MDWEQAQQAQAGMRSGSKARAQHGAHNVCIGKENMPSWLRAAAAERNYEQHVNTCQHCQSGLTPGGCREERRLHDIVWRELNGR